ncbi:MAG: AAA family ATPase [Thermodesulfobacteriota bacterium]
MLFSLRLQQFKNFQDATLALGPLTVIVGTNASGKSNLRDAFRFLHGMARGYTLAEILGAKYVEGGVLQWAGIRGGTREVAYQGQTRFTLTTEGKEDEPTDRKPGFRPILFPYTHTIGVDVGDPGSEPHVVRESLGHWSPIFDSHPQDDRPAQEGPPYLFVRLPRDERNRRLGKRLRFLDNRPVLSQFAGHREAGKLYRASAEECLTTLRSMRFLDLSPEAMKVPSVPGQLVLGDRGENLSSVLQAICKDTSTKSALAAWVRELTPLDVVDFDFVPDQTGRVLLTLIEAGGQRISAHSASDGTLRFLAMIAALMGPDAAKFYFLEELDNGIHPTRLHLLLQLIEQQTRERQVQIVTTSHSPQLLAMLSDTAREHASLVYRLAHAPAACIRRVMEIPEIRRVLAEQNLARLHESGWLEDALAFTEPEEAVG